ncbi:hypothetical protein Tco_0156460 [Tanacetum coccineum]
MAFPVVEYYVKNNWNKYGLKRIMMNAKGFFFFQFNTRDGLDDVLEGGPWMIRNSPIILKEWTMKTSLHKEELTSIPVWVKFHDVPIQIFEEEGISLIATYIGKPIMLDSFTSSMRTLLLVFLITDGPGFSKENIRVEYEWKPSRCPNCNIFGHTSESCPKRVVAAPEVTNIVRDDHDDGFQQVHDRKHNSKGNTKGKQAIPRGVPMSKGFQVGKEFAFNPKATVLDSNGGSKSAANSKASSSSSLNKGNLDTHSNVSKPGPSITTNDRHSTAHWNDGGKKSIVIDSNSNLNTSIPTSNPYDALKSLNEDDDSEEEDVENIFDESVNLFTSQTGASTPADIGFNSHVDVSIVYDTCRKVCTRWKWTSNGGLCTKGDCIVPIILVGEIVTIFCRFIYADNYYVDRRALWNNLAVHGSFMQDKPWVLLGDFNAALNLEDHSCGGIICYFSPNRIPDHTHVCSNSPKCQPNQRPFKFSKLLVIRKGFRKLFANGWNLNINGCAMFRLVKRLKGLKSPLRKLLYDQGNLHARVTQIRGELDEAESKIEWLDAGDSNTAYFHNVVKSRNARNRIEMFLGVEGSVTPLDNHDLFSRVLDVQKAAHMVMECLAVAEVNPTIIALIPKVTTPCDLGDLLNAKPIIGNWGHPYVLSSQSYWVWLPSTKLEWIMVCVSTTSIQCGINDDLFLFARGHLDSVSVIMDTLEEFMNVSGLVPSIPKIRIISDLEQLMRGFLWCQGEMKKGKAKVAWDSVCLGLKEGGLGIRRLEEFNTALMDTPIWSF